MDYFCVLWTTIFAHFSLFVVAFDWEYAALYSFNQSTYSLKIFQNETSESYLHFLTILGDEADEHGFEEAEEAVESWEGEEVLVSHGDKLTLHQNLLFAFEIEDDSAVSVFTLNFHEPQIYVFFFEHDADELPFKLVDSSGILVVPLIEESGHDHTTTTEETEDGHEDDHEDDYVAITSQTWGLSILASLLTSIISITGLLFFFTLKNDKAKSLVLNVSYAFGSGALLAASFIHLIPESFVFLEDSGDVEEIGWKIGTVILAGILCSLCIHAIFSYSQHEVESSTSIRIDVAVRNEIHPEAPEAPEASQCKTKQKEINSSPISSKLFYITMKKLMKVNAVCWNIFLGDLIHNFLDGVLIAAAFAGCGQSTGWTIMGAIMAHEIPQEIADFFILLKSGMSIFQATAFNLLSGVFSVLGAIIFLSVSHTMTLEDLGYMLLWSSGIFVFIGATELLPEVLKGGPIKIFVLKMFAFILGAVVVSLPLLNHAHCDAGTLGHEHDDHSETISSSSEDDDHDDHDH